MPSDGEPPVDIKDRKDIIVWHVHGYSTEAELVNDGEYGWCWSIPERYCDLKEVTHYMIIQPPN